MPSVNGTDSNNQCQISVFSGYTEFRGPSLTVTEKKGGGTRKSITKFSPRSRINLLKKIFSLPTSPSLFITLTYPKYYPAESSEWKRHLDNFRHALKIKFPKLYFFWKLEPQKRGAPHYHLIGDLGSDLNIVVLRQLIANLWFTTCGTGDPKHLAAGTQADYLNDSKGKLQAYVSKYVGKVDLTEYEGWKHPGRFWGIIGRKNLPPALSRTINLSFSQFFIVRRIVRKWLKHQSANSHKYSNRLKGLIAFPLFIEQRIIEQFLRSVVEKLPDLSLLELAKC